MICATLGRGRHSALLAEWKAAAEAGAELVELRIDCLRREPNLKRLLAERFTPIIFTVRRGTDGGLWRGDEEKRRRLLREAIIAGVDYVDLEVDVAKDVRRYGPTKRIISVHDFKKTPEKLDDLGKEMREHDPDVVKVATLAKSPGDATRILEFVASASTLTVGIAMGEMGFFTRVLGAKYGAPFTYSGFNPDRTFAPGMPRFLDLKNDYFHDRINAQTEVYGVIGDPIGHSLSPAVHNAAFRHLGLNKILLPFHVPNGRLKESLDALNWIGLKGFSVTIPHKEAIVPLLSRIDKSVDRTGACNTVVVEPDGETRVGHNTDYRAAMESLEVAMGGANPDDASPLLNKQALILGAGGVARSFALGLARRGAAVSIASRTGENANRLAEAVGCRSLNWSNRAANRVDVLVNCTPVGMHPEVDDTPMPPAGFRPGTIVFDTVYHPENTMFLKLARERECQTITGVDMFVRQAALQFEYYTGHPAPVDLMREVVRRKLSPLREDSQGV